MRCGISDFVQAHSTLEEEVYQGLAGRGFDLANDKLPDSIQLFPPGTHSITALKNGKSASLTVTVDAKAAEAVKRDFLAMVKAAEAGNGPKPFIDFNHDDKEASGWPIDVVWAGDNPESGGIRATVEWSKPGGDAILGKAYRQFSPNFRVSPATGEIIGTTANMGGLVNRPAFRTINPFFAKDGNGSNTPKSMEKITQALVALGLLSAVTTDEAQAVIDLNKNFGTFQAKAAERAGATLTETVKAKDAEIATLTVERDGLKAKHKNLAEAHAQAVIGRWVETGLISAKDEAGKAKWLAMLVADPSAEELMAPVIMAKQAQGATQDVTKPVTQKTVTTKTETANGGADHPFTVKAKEIADTRKVSEADAMVITAKENPKMYEDYRKGLLYVEDK